MWIVSAGSSGDRLLQQAARVSGAYSNHASVFVGALAVLVVADFITPPASADAVCRVGIPILVTASRYFRECARSHRSLLSQPCCVSRVVPLSLSQSVCRRLPHSFPCPSLFLSRPWPALAPSEWTPSLAARPPASTARVS
eukprot:4137290-Pleurochrysis_carterae.AAC.1